jgi:hypothetical protein
MYSADGDGQYSWPYVIHAYAIKHDFEIKGVCDIESLVREYPVSMLPKRLHTQVKAKASKDKFKYREYHKNYAEDHGYYPCMIRGEHEIRTIGGDAYDVSKMSMEDRKRHALGN